MVKTRYGEVPLAVATIEDDTGRIKLNLWRNQADMVKVGNFVKIENGFVRSFRNELQLNVGSKGRITIVER
jgi:replication factor A1